MTGGTKPAYDIVLSPALSQRAGDARIEEVTHVLLSVVTKPAYGRNVEISLHGEIDLSNAHEVRDLVTEILAGPRPEQIRCDLRLVSMIDSVGIGVLVSCYHAAAACRVPFVVVNPNLTVYRQLWVSGLVGLFGSPEPITTPSGPVPTTN